MNVRMWQHAATQANLATLKERGLRFVGPNEGDMACGEYGPGRMAEPDEIVAAIDRYFGANARLAGRKAIVTSGPTHEAIDPVRYIANRSSGKQGHAIAQALARLGAETVLVSGPTQLADPAGVEVIHVESAREMLSACQRSLPANQAGQKLKKDANQTAPALELTPNPDILASLSAAGNTRPSLVIGFAAETENVVENAKTKLARKGCDWILANDVSPASGTFGGDNNVLHLINSDGAESWPRLTKQEAAERLAGQIANHFKQAS